MNFLKHVQKLNFKILLSVFILCICSLFTLKNINPLLNSVVSNTNFYTKQLTGMIMGLILAILVYHINLSKIKKYIDWSYIILMIMLLILAFNPPFIGSLFVNNSNGANGWFMFFTPSLSIQPVEFLKIILVLKLAKISQIHLSSSQKDSILTRQYLLVGGIPIFLVLIEPDLGGAILLSFFTLIMFIFSIKNKKVLLKYLLIFLIFLIIFSFLLFTTEGQDFLIKWTPLERYQFNRLDAWTKPFSTTAGYQLQQSLIFIGSSGAWGHGAGFSKIAIPESQTDLIFTAFVGFFGFVAGIILIFLYIILTWEMLKISEKQKNLNFKLIALGFTTLFFIQFIENIGMMIGLFPITGVVLPYMSYGQSAMITYFIIIAIMLNLYTHSYQEEIYNH